MSTRGVYSLKLERLSAERHQSIIRLLLSIITSLVLLKFCYDGGLAPSEEIARVFAEHSMPGADRSLGITSTQLNTVITLFMIYSIVVWAMVRFRPDKLKITMAASSLIEIGLITYLINVTAWTGIPFYLWYIFYVVTVATRYGWLHSINEPSACRARSSIPTRPKCPSDAFSARTRFTSNPTPSSSTSKVSRPPSTRTLTDTRLA